MNRLLRDLLLGGSATALLAGISFTAQAQNNNASALDVETIQSSVSRIDLKGFEAPTPVTVIGIETLNRDAKTNLGDAIRELPQVRSGASITAGSNSGCISQLNAGVDSIQIRGLGASRNLVLFDRQRVVPAALQDGTAGGSAVDVALIPQGLTQRVDVVTGGASSAWGSDAVTGVINIVINKTFQGFKGSFTYANSTEVSNPVYRASLAWGTSFLGGKGHTVIGYDYTQQSDPVFAGEAARDNHDNGRAFVINPAYCGAVAFPVNGSVTATTGGTCSSANAGQPILVYAYGVGNAITVVGGNTATNTAGTTGSGLTANSLKNVMFAGADGSPTQFYTGTVSNTTQCYNGCSNDQYGTGGWGSNNPYHSAVYFNYTSYQILPDLKASIQLNYSRLNLRAQGSGSAVAGTNKTIYADNPYLPDAIAKRFVCNTTGVPVAGPGTSTCVNTLSNGYNPYTRQNETNAFIGGVNTALTIGALQARPAQSLGMNFDFSGNSQSTSPTASDSVDSIEYTYDARCRALNRNCGYYNKDLKRGVFTLDGTIGDSWTWSAYLQWGQNRVRETVQNVIVPRVNNALDAVRVTSGNVGTSGLAVGSIQCRGMLNIANASPVAVNSLGVSTATELAGCVPFNPFGLGVISNATYNYVRPGANVAKTGSENVLMMKITQTAAAYSMSGVLPWQLPAGEIGVAFGGEWRLDSGGITELDVRSLLALYPSGNILTTFTNHTHVEEGFLEVAVPLLKDNIVQTLNLDLAGRMTNYSFSGLVETWKIGLQSQVNDDFRLRATWSYDIRAPNIWDLFSPGGISSVTAPSFIVGPTGSNGGNPALVRTVAGGNPDLQPERANTMAAGVVFTPTFWGLEGLTASFDWYQIHLHGAIVQIGQAAIIDRCRAGELVWCSQIVFERQGSFAAAQGCGLAGIGNECAGGDTTSTISTIYTRGLNASSLNTAGFDFSVAYGFDLFTGQATVGFNGNYVYDYSRDQSGINFQGAGGTASFYSGGAKFQGTLNLDYREGAWSFGTQFRMTGESVMDLGTQGQALLVQQSVIYTGTAASNIATLSSGQRNPDFGAVTNYNAMVVSTDLRVQYRWSNNITLFAAVDNLQNLPTAGGQQRRTYRGGLRFNY